MMGCINGTSIRLENGSPLSGKRPSLWNPSTYKNNSIRPGIIATKADTLLMATGFLSKKLVGTFMFVSLFTFPRHRSQSLIILPEFIHLWVGIIIA